MTKEWNEIVPSAEVERRTRELEGAGWTIVRHHALDHANVVKGSGQVYSGPATRLVYKKTSAKAKPEDRP